MVCVPGGEFVMGSLDFFPEEQPLRTVSVEPFWMDAHPVTNTAFRRFVRATDYVTMAERELNPADFPGADPADLVPGALVFTPTSGPVPLDDWRRWWSWSAGACWRHPGGAGTNLDGREHHPVIHIAYADAAAYAEWAGKTLPSEEQWEFAARGGLAETTYAWGAEFEPRGRRMANTWVGRFPWEFLPGRGQTARPGTTKVAGYPPNGYGLFDMTGNVWEWTTDYFRPGHREAPATSCCSPTGGPAGFEPPPLEPGERFARRVVKGGSYLCAPNYCLRYRPAARQGQTEDTATAHLGFRCITPN
ncbi:formylglycine-generating enzyme family protein [Nocardia sp. NPDC057668]|uniref:formylglycine-generating enzyme family protein n=1 Tax=Nocardia sp. NPDC057668 TaxID=3346202 RepID=UPI00366BD783